MADSVDELFQEPMLAEEAIEEPAPVEIPEQPEVEPEPEPQAEPEPEVEAPKDERTVPLATFLDQRDRLKDSERRIAEYEARQRSQPQQPDPFDDPEGFAAHTQQQVHQAIISDRFERSNEDAVEKWGEDKVKDAIAWATERAQKNPTFAAEYMSKPRPIHWIVQQHQRDAMLSDIGDNVDDWFTREAAKRGYVAPSVTTTASAVVPPASPPAKVPRSLANQGSAPSDVRQTATGPLVGVDALFN